MARTTAAKKVTKATKPRKLTTKDENICKLFGTRLTTLRTERGLRQIDMADTFGIDRGYISEMENGNKSPSLVMLQVLARGFGMTTVAELLGDL